MNRSHAAFTAAFVLIILIVAGCVRAGAQPATNGPAQPSELPVASLDAAGSADPGCEAWTSALEAPEPTPDGSPTGPLSGWPWEPPILATGEVRPTLAGLKAGSAAALAPRTLPNRLTLQAVVLTPTDGATIVRQFFAPAPIGDAMTLTDFLTAGGVLMTQQPTIGGTAASVIENVGEANAQAVRLGASTAALIHGSPRQSGVRPWALYWSDGTSDFSLKGGVTSSDLMAIARSIYCTP